MQVNAVVDDLILSIKLSMTEEWQDKIYYEQIYPWIWISEPEILRHPYFYYFFPLKLLNSRCNDFIYNAEVWATKFWKRRLKFVFTSDSTDKYGI